MSERTFTAVVHREEDLFVAECPDEWEEDLKTRRHSR
jgi:hypothetical protein